MWGKKKPIPPVNEEHKKAADDKPKTAPPITSSRLLRVPEIREKAFPKGEEPAPKK